MGGGDLNAKKAWHPNTLKNQERVWKAEQAAAQEKKRIVELERERQLERERAELNHIAKSNFGPVGAANDDRLHWMYEKPDKKVQHEEYLLGKAIDKNHEQAGKSEMDEIPAVSRRVVGSSMLSISGDAQVDLARKIREDPLLLVKERERAARAALLNNPVQRARLTELLRKEQENKKESKSKKKKKKDKDLDNILAEKLQALSGNKGIDLATLLASDDSSSESSDEKSKKKKKKKKAKSKKNISNDSDSESEEEKQLKVNHKSKKEVKKLNKHNKKRSADSDSDEESNIKKKKRDHSVKDTRKSNVNRGSSDDQQSSDENEMRYNQHLKTDHAGDNMIKGDRYWQNNRYTSDYRQSKDDREKQYQKDDRYPRDDRHARDNRYGKEDRSRDDRYGKEDRSRDDRYGKEDRSRDDRYGKEDRSRDNRYGKEDRSRDDKYSRDNRNSRDNYKSEKGRPYGQTTFSSHDKEKSKRSGLSEEEKAAKLAEMVAAGAEWEKQRERRVAEQLAEKDPADRPPNAQSRSNNVIRQLPDSLESRLHSNRHYIQRDKRHMNENFAKR